MTAHTFITMKIYRETRQNLKILAALREETSAEVLDKLVSAALRAEQQLQIDRIRGELENAQE
jgi:hypothetical protein